MGTEVINFHGRELQVATQNGTHYVAVRPICDAIDIDFSSQKKTIKNDPVLNSVVVLITTTGADGKSYPMMCLPMSHINGWLFKIDTRRVKREAREAVVLYQRECYQVLADHFLRRVTPLRVSQDALGNTERYLLSHARRRAAMVRYELRRIVDRYHLRIEDAVQMLREAGEVRTTYCGFEEGVWDRGQLSEEFVEQVGRDLLNNVPEACPMPAEVTARGC